MSFIRSIFDSASSQGVTTSETVTITAPVSTTIPPTNTTLPNTTSLQSDFLVFFDSFLSNIFPFALYWLLTCLLFNIKRITRKVLQTWNTAQTPTFHRPWLTPDMPTLIGLIGLTHDHKWSHTPLWYHTTIQRTWHQPNRYWLKRLLAKGVIPLYIDDGGLGTQRVPLTRWGVQAAWPFVTWPRYAQCKKRAYFEFVVPFPYATRGRKEFLEGVVNNRGIPGCDARKCEEEVVNEESVGVMVRHALGGRLDEGTLKYSTMNPPERSSWALEVGADSAVEFLLPFKQDRIMKPGYGKRCHPLSYYIHDWNAAKMPALSSVETMIVRVESRHYGHCELDRFVFDIAQKVGLETRYDEKSCREAAIGELERCNLPVEGLQDVHSCVFEGCS